MKDIRQLIISLITLTLLTINPLTTLVHAQDWPVYQHDVQHSGYNSDETRLSPPLSLLWTDAITSSNFLDVVGNTLYTADTSGNVFAIDTTSGATKWQTKMDSGGGAGVAVSGNTVYAGCGDNCKLYAFDATTGNKKWSTSATAIFVNVDGNTVLTGSNSWQIQAFDATTGNNIWTTGTNDGMTSIPAVSNGVVYAGQYGNGQSGIPGFYAINETNGNIIWHNTSMPYGFFWGPTVNNGTVYTGGRDHGGVYALDAVTGNIKWHVLPNISFSSTPAIDNNILYVQDTDSGHVYALDPINGNTIWTSTIPQGNSGGSSPVVANGVVYIGSSDKNIYALDTQTGNELWHYGTTGIVATPIIADHKLFVPTEDGKIYTFTTLAQNISLNVPLLKQTSNPWQSQTYDTAYLWNPSNPTINAWGCAMTSAAMVFNYYGLHKLPNGTALDPGTLNAWLKSQQDGYVGQGWVNWLALSRLSKLATSINNISSFDALEYQRTQGNNATQLTDDLTNAIPDILEEPGHFIVAKGTENSTFDVNDPYFTFTTLQNTKYNNTFLSLGKYIPSHTNLAYIMAVTDQDIDIKLLDGQGNQLGTEFLQQPISNPLNPKQTNGQPMHFFYFQKPATGIYNIVTSSTKSKEYLLNFYLYDKNGNVLPIQQSSFIDSGAQNQFNINFNVDTIKNSVVSKSISFQNIIKDIKQAEKSHLIFPLVGDSLIGVINNIQKNQKNKFIVKQYFNTGMLVLEKTRKIGIKEDAYQIIHADFLGLKVLLGLTDLRDRD